MLNRLISEDKINGLKKLIDNAEKIVVTCHLTPDGDAMGSSLAMYHMLSALGKKVHVVTPDVPASYLMFIPGAKEIIPFTRFEDFARQLFREADLVICLDFNALHRIDRLRPLVEQSPAEKVLIDHHINPEDFAGITISHPEQSSTCLLLFRVLCQLGYARIMDRKTATCILTGMMTDTGNFQYNSIDPDIYIVVAELLKKGVDKYRIYKLAFNTKSESQMRLNAYAISQKMTVFPEHRAAMIVLTLDELKEFNYQQGDTEGLVNMPLAMPDVEYVGYLREGKDYVKVSTRSEGEVPVNELCANHFNGGGHKNAAGGEFYGTLDDCVKAFVEALPEMDKYVNKNNRK